MGSTCIALWGFFERLLCQESGRSTGVVYTIDREMSCQTIVVTLAREDVSVRNSMLQMREAPSQIQFINMYTYWLME